MQKVFNLDDLHVLDLKVIRNHAIGGTNVAQTHILPVEQSIVPDSYSIIASAKTPEGR